jgi:hypothetical protein
MDTKEDLVFSGFRICKLAGSNPGYDLKVVCYGIEPNLFKVNFSMSTE